jgi:branched-chain amino acid transport system ATP-binding protein
MSAALRVDGACVNYDKLEAVRSVTLELAKGELVLLLGANGAGKSSLINSLVGLVPMRDGTIELDGETVDSLAPAKRVARGLGYLPEGRGVFPTLTVEENLQCAVGNKKQRAETLERSYSMFPRLGERKRQVAGSLSGGEQQMLSLSRAMARDPRVLLLDEPSLGLAPRVVSDLFETIGGLRDGGMTILLVEQFAHAALAIADRAGVMVRGQLGEIEPASAIRALSPEELTEKYFQLQQPARTTDGQAPPAPDHRAR